MILFTRYWQKLVLLSFGHGLNDFAAGYMLGSLLYLKEGINEVAIGFLMYNVLAFGGQYFAAMLIEKVSSMKLMISAASIANVLAVSVFVFLPELSLVLAGCASAVYHVAGGVACTNENKAAPIGVFAAPGIVGLVLAGYLSYLRVDVWFTLILLCSGFVVMIQLLRIPRRDKREESAEKPEAIGRHDVMMMILLAVISLRSAVWNIFQVIHEHNYTWLLAIAGSAFLGKLLGGWIADRVGWKLYSLVSLAAAMPLVTFVKEEIILFCIGVGLLQSAIPANAAMMIQYCRGQKEKGIAFSFGTAVVIGIVLTVPLPLLSTGSFIFWILFCLLLLSIRMVQKRNFPIRKRQAA